MMVVLCLPQTNNIERFKYINVCNVIMTSKEKITFNDLSTSLKVLVVGGWFVVGLFAFYFIVGVIAGIMGVPLE